MSVEKKIEHTISDNFEFSHLEVINESHMHSGPNTETHFKVVLVSEEFEDAGIIKINDNSYGMNRIEVRCSGCESHLGHLFHESKGPRYFINSICLKFEGK